MPDNQQVGLFLGAGASFELGMPTYLASHRRVQRLFYVCPFTQTQRRLAPTRRRLRRFSNEKIGFWYGGQKVRTINEITYADECGEMQFLRRTLLAGAQKFNEHFPQTLPQMMLKMFRSHINFVGKLYVPWRLFFIGEYCKSIRSLEAPKDSPEISLPPHKYQLFWHTGDYHVSRGSGVTKGGND